MKLPHRLAVRLSPLVEAARGEPLVEPFATLTERSGRCLVLSSSYGEFTFDRERGMLLQDGQEAAAFDSVQSVDLAAFPGGLGTKSWSITLYRSFLDRITVARTYDDGEASVIAARLARVLGCKVVSLVGSR